MLLLKHNAYLWIQGLFMMHVLFLDQSNSWGDLSAPLVPPALPFFQRSILPKTADSINVNKLLKKTKPKWKVQTISKSTKILPKSTQKKKRIMTSVKRPAPPPPVTDPAILRSYFDRVDKASSFSCPTIFFMWQNELILHFLFLHYI